MSRVILTDCDGVLLDWESSFIEWMARHGEFKENPELSHVYCVGERYNIPNKREYVEQFNNSASIGFIRPYRDSIKYIRKLHEEMGFVFHVITSLSDDPHSQQLRIQNLEKFFGPNVFERYIFTSTGGDKDDVLEEYRGSGLLWVEDKLENAVLGENIGLESVLMRHQHNYLNEHQIPTVANWREIYDYF